MIILFYFFNYLFYFQLHWVFIAAWAFSSCSTRGLLFVVGLELVIVAASLVAEHWL